MSIELLSRVRGQGWGVVEEVYIGGDRMEGPRWFLEIKEGLKVSKLLMELENDVAKRNAFILIDNSNELFLRYFIQNRLKQKIEEKISFPELIKRINKQGLIEGDIIDDIQMYHNTRNNLYHDPKVLSVSNKVLGDFYIVSKKLYKNVLGVEISEDEEESVLKSFESKIIQNRRIRRFQDLERLENDIKSVFGFTPDDPLDILIATVPGYTRGGEDVFRTLFFGALARDPVDGKNVRVLEFVNFNTENSWHDFYLSYIGSNVWHGIVKCFWSKWGEGDRRSINKIHKLIKKHEDKVIYHQSPRLDEYYWRGSLDQFFGEMD